MEKKKGFFKLKTMNALFCALDKKEFYTILGYSNTYKICKKLEVVYEGSNQVKESKSVHTLGNMSYLR